MICNGCDRENKPGDPHASPNETVEQESHFVGTIRASQTLGSATLHSAEITYTIGKGKIRRESFSTDKLEKLLKSQTRAGIICDLARDEVILYCAKPGKKHFCRLTLAEYSALVKELSFGPNKDAHQGFGHLFLDVPAKPPVSTHQKEHTTIQNYSCDRYSLSFKKWSVLVTVETDHSPEIKVDQRLLELVEPNISSQITGFPLRIHRYNKSTSKPQEGWMKLLDKAAKLAEEKLNKLLKWKYDLTVTEIKAEAPDASQFELSDDFIEVPNLKTFEGKFYEPGSSSGFDFD